MLIFIFVVTSIKVHMILIPVENGIFQHINAGVGESMIMQLLLFLWESLI